MAFRCNLVYLDVRPPKVLMGDYSAGHITTEEAKSLIEDFDGASGARNSGFSPASATATSWSGRAASRRW